MSHGVVISKNAPKAKVYDELYPQVAALLEGEPDALACLANMVAALKEALGHLWVGIYIVRGSELVLGPFQGPVACTRIAYGRGVCGTAWKEGRVLVVDDVDAFPGHIACSALSKSEIVVPLRCSENGEIWGVLDIDSEKHAAFDSIDAEALLRLLSLLGKRRL